MLSSSSIRRAGNPLPRRRPLEATHLYHQQRSHRLSSSIARFQEENRPQLQQEGSPSPGLVDVHPEEHWSSLLTTMPDLSCRHWSGRLGNFVLSSAPAADVVSSGAVLHLWKATGSSATDSMSWQQDAAAQGGNVHEGGSAIDEVAVRYFTAEGLDVSTPGDGSVGLSPDGSRVVWDQKALQAKPTAFTFSPRSPQLSLTLPAPAAPGIPSSDQQQQQQTKQAPVPLYRTMRLLPLSSSGVCVLNAALPAQFGEELAAANPPGSYWFFEVLLTHPDAAGAWQGSTLGVAYDWSSGRLHSHKYLWQKATSPLKPPRDDLNRVLLAPVTPPTRDSSLSLQDLVHKLAHTPNLHHTITTFSYSSSSSSSGGGGGDQQQRLQRSHSSGPAPPAAVATALQGLDTVVGPVGPVESAKSSCSSVHAWFTGMQGSRPTQHPAAAAAAAAAAAEPVAAAAAGGSEAGGEECDARQQVLWFPEGGCWARVPAQLPSQQEGAAGPEGLVEFEMGVMRGDGEGAARCVLQFSCGGDRRIAAVINEEWRQAQ